MTSLTPNLLPNTWTLPDEDALPVHDARCDFTPMLVVSMWEGVVLNRMAEVLPHKDGPQWKGWWK